MQSLNAQSPPRLVPLAPAVNSSQQSQSDGGQPHLAQYACVNCARRKVKCDKEQPCSACRKSRVECHYQAPAPIKRKRRPVDEMRDDTRRRLDRYERILKEHGLLSKAEEPEITEQIRRFGSSAYSPSSMTSPDQDNGVLLSGPGKTRYVQSNIWNSLGEDMHTSSDDEIPESDQNETKVTRAPFDPIDPASAAFLGTSSPSQLLSELHPPYEIAMKLWKFYVRNVDPIVKMVHIPTGTAMMEEVAANPSRISKSTECLLFVVYHFAIISMTESECQDAFGESWESLRERYHNAARQALVGCSLFKTLEFKVVQAYILFLLSVRNHYDPQTLWILTGIGVRLAQRVGLHRDGEDHGLSPFDTEIRRRVWWQLLPLDGYASHLSGTGISMLSGTWDTKKPLNINDEDIWPGITETPSEKNGATEMIFCVVRFEIGKFHYLLNTTLGDKDVGKNVESAQRSLQEMEDNVEKNYIRYCDVTIPIHYLTIAMARASMSYAKFRLRLAQAGDKRGSFEERKELYALAVKVLNHDIACHSNSSVSRYFWHLQVYFQWHSLIWTLNEIRCEETVVDDDTAWEIVQGIFNGHPEMLAQRRSIDVAVRRLALKAWDVTLKRGRMTGAEPALITSLKRHSSLRASRQTTETPKPSPNWNPRRDASDVTFVQNHVTAGNEFSYLDMSGLDDLDSEVDWTYWDQLIYNPESFGKFG